MCVSGGEQAWEYKSVAVENFCRELKTKKTREASEKINGVGGNLADKQKKSRKKRKRESSFFFVTESPPVARKKSETDWRGQMRGALLHCYIRIRVL